MEDLENQGAKPKRRTLDLSLTQVAASALAAVVGAVLASQLGVYGTILGAAVVSIGATTGTAVLQHLFRRTGEQLREMTATTAELEHPASAAEPAGDKETQVFDPFDPGGDHTRMMARINPPDQGEAVAVYRGRTNLKPKSWKVYAVTATIVFGLAMGTVGVIEVASGKPAANFFGGSGGSGGGGKPNSGASAPVDPSSGASTSADHAGDTGRSGGTSGTGGQGSSNSGNASPNPGTSSSPHPSTSPSQSPDPVTTPTPTPDTSSGAATPQTTPSS
ncbi:hypothetical protein DN069_00295 [Streptacidiphilus pinicola]|uniref:Uncharacterized protein n=1 Tax=Streptacidiphilus pinicola TaxID=2219663 RepID=A0A2X0KLS0_9ACTN|nr:hypothetical protein [Streptacidiphilus pinicola]RAG87600.1 hypothetical protein DN069_00295 [Streptacidiphilus pinicola]